MHLQKLDLRGIRNLQPTQLFFSPRVNFFYGANGSGKTSFLEAVYLLGRGRSFRTRNPLSVMSREADEFLVVGVLEEGGRATISIGVQRKRSGAFLLKVGGEMVYSSSMLAEALPLLLLNADSFLLLDGGPQGRRRYLDWGVFHVEQSYRELWKRFQRALKQRNSLLRRDRIDEASLATWDQEFVMLAEQVDFHRKRYAEQLIPAIQQVLSELGQKLEVTFSYYEGWNSSKPLIDVLREDRHRDVQSGTTHHGPHRADLKVRIGRVGASELLSRGQAKVLVSAMLVAQGQLFQRLTDKQCIYLLDDLPSELDKNHRKRVGKLLNALGSQVFVTGADKEDLLASWPELAPDEIGLFHVEHGRISPQKPS